MGVPQQEFDAQLDGLTEKGRGIYFYHDRTSDLPVRDITRRGKKEPHIEYGFKRRLNDGCIIGAENYCYSCYQEAVRRLLASDEKYLFLLTTPQNRDMERQIVGYIEKHGCESPDGTRMAVTGRTMLYSFDDAIPASELGKRTRAPLGKYGETFDEDETETVLTHFENFEDVTEECLQEVQRLEDTNSSDDSDSGGC